MHELGLAADKVRVITPFVGGGFGGKGEFQQGVEAAKLAKMNASIQLSGRGHDPTSAGGEHAVEVTRRRGSDR